jgi:hypothetical protein
MCVTDSLGLEALRSSYKGLVCNNEVYDESVGEVSKLNLPLLKSFITE